MRGAETTRPRRIALRPMRVTDAERVHEWASRAAACRFQAWGPNTLAETRSFVTEAARTWQLDPPTGRRVWVAVSQGLGVVGSGEVNERTHSCLEIAYAVHTDHWGQGLGTEIARCLADVAFADAAVERVQATCDPRNLASAAVLRRAGLTLEGTLRHTMPIRDGWRDSAMYSVLRREWADHTAEGARAPVQRADARAPPEPASAGARRCR